LAHDGVAIIWLLSGLRQRDRNMDDGFSVLFSHRTKGTVRSYIPYPTELPHLREICALDPSA
jgi:hypothetical protein